MLVWDDSRWDNWVHIIPSTFDPKYVYPKANYASQTMMILANTETYSCWLALSQGGSLFFQSKAWTSLLQAFVNQNTKEFVTWGGSIKVYQGQHPSSKHLWIQYKTLWFKRITCKAAQTMISILKHLAFKNINICNPLFGVLFANLCSFSEFGATLYHLIPFFSNGSIFLFYLLFQSSMYCKIVQFTF